MIREYEATGKTVEEAREAGYAALGVSADDLNVSYAVVDYPVKKLFKSVPAKVKITVELPDEEKPAAPAPAAAKPAAPAAAKPAAPTAEKPAAPAKYAAPAAEKPVAKAEPNRETAEDEAESPIDIETNEKVKAAVDYLREVIGCMGVKNATFAAVTKGEATIIHIDGDGMGALIGRRGETMESLSYLASLVANRMGGDYIKLGLDVAGYRSKREQDLTVLAQRIGQKVLKTNRSFAMEPMNPYERRLIHAAIGRMEGLRSESKGEGKDRRVVIYSTAPDAQNDNPDSEHRGRTGGSFRTGSRPAGRSGGYRGGRNGDRSGGRDFRQGGGSRPRSENRGPRLSSVPERSFEARDAAEATPVAPKRTDHVDDFAGFGFGKIDL